MVVARTKFISIATATQTSADHFSAMLRVQLIEYVIHVNEDSVNLRNVFFFMKVIRAEGKVGRRLESLRSKHDNALEKMPANIRVKTSIVSGLKGLVSASFSKWTETSNSVATDAHHSVLMGDMAYFGRQEYCRKREGLASEPQKVHKKNASPRVAQGEENNPVA